MERRRMIISIAGINDPECLEYHATFQLKNELVSEAAREFALIFIGYQPFVFASFPVATKQDVIEKKMEELWKKYKLQAGQK